MKISRFFSLALMLLIQTASTTVFAQKAGDIITGVLSDDEGPMLLAKVMELDSNDRIVANALTDMEGEFSFRLVNPKDRLRITYVGYETVDIPIDKLHFEIKMKRDTWGTKLVPAYNAGFEFIACKETYGHGHFGCIPEDFICGYFFKPNPSRTIPYCIFLIQDSEGYKLVYNHGRDQSQIIRINRKQALRMAQSVKDTIDNAVTEQYHNVEFTGYPNQLYAIMPDRMAERWADEIPDPEWNKMLKRLESK